MAKAKKENKSEKDTDKPASRAEQLGAVVKSVNKKYKGASVLANARHDPRLVVPRVSTGLYGLDVATNGGYPLGRVTLIYGEAKGGKTTSYLRGLSNAQRLCGTCSRPAEYVPGVIELPDLETGEMKDVETFVIKECACGNPTDMLCFWVDAEGVWLPEWADKMDVWSEKVILMRPTYGEQGYDVLTSFAETRAINMVAIDSLAQMTPSDEYKSGMDEKQQGAAARMNNKFIRKVVGLMNHSFQQKHSLTTWLINQYREKIGVMFGSNKTLPGGKAQLFANSIEVEFSPGKIDIDPDTGEPIIGLFKWAVKKNKLGPSGGRGEFQQWMMNTDLFSIGDIQEHEQVIQKAVSLGFIEHPNAVMYEFDGEKFRGESTLVRYLAENPELYVLLKEKMLRKKLHIDD
jgi:recombination protein RecA